MKVLAIESSCDETSVALLENGQVLSQVVATQDEIHAPFGGVVPELASRRHLELMMPVLHTCLKKAGLELEHIDAIAVTNAPGLVGSLLVGLTTAKSLSVVLQKPFIGVNHLEAHLNAHFLEQADFSPHYVGLVVSGGHTSLYHVKDFGNYELLGATRDDACGEAYDKVAKLLKLGYPGGPIIDRRAKTGDKKAFRYTRPNFSDQKTYDFSFSGYKTATMWKYKEASEHDETFKANLAASFQDSVTDFLCERIFRAAKEKQAPAVVISGGVAANSVLREKVTTQAKALGLEVGIPPMKYCTDNAAMIGYVGWRYLERGKKSDLSLGITPNQEIGI